MPRGHTARYLVLWLWLCCDCAVTLCCFCTVAVCLCLYHCSLPRADWRTFDSLLRPLGDFVVSKLGASGPHANPDRLDHRGGVDDRTDTHVRRGAVPSL